MHYITSPRPPCVGQINRVFFSSVACAFELAITSCWGGRAVAVMSAPSPSENGKVGVPWPPRPVESRVICLAPMVSANRLPFRELAFKYGADVAYSEELIAQRVAALSRGRAAAWLLFQHWPFPMMARVIKGADDRG